MAFKLYKNCSIDSLHCPSRSFEILISACRNIFCDQFDQVKHKPGVLHHLLESCLLQLNELSSSGFLRLDCAVCCKDTVQRAMALFLRIMLHHKLKVDNRATVKVTKAQRRNRKAIKVLHQ
jgi:hypothetical protein